MTSVAGQDGSVLTDIAIDDDHVIVELKENRLSVVKVLHGISSVEFLHNDDGDGVVALSRRSTEVRSNNDNNRLINNHT